MRQGDDIAKSKGFRGTGAGGAGAGIAGAGGAQRMKAKGTGPAIASPSHVAEWLADEQLGYDAVLLCAHTRAYALRGAALSLVPDPGAFSSTLARAAGLTMLRAGLFEKFLAVATQDLTTSAHLSLGRDAAVAMHLPLVYELTDR